MKTTNLMKRLLLSTLMVSGLFVGVAYMSPTHVLADEVPTSAVSNETKGGTAIMEYERNGYRAHFDWTLSDGNLVIKDGGFIDFSETTARFGTILYDLKIERSDVKTITFEGSKMIGNTSTLFEYLPNLTKVDVSKLDISEVTDTSKWFARDHKLTTLDISGPNWENNHINNMGSMFGDSALTTIKGLDKLNISHSTDLSGLFQCSMSPDAYQFTKNVAEVIKDWDVSNVDNYNTMFYTYTDEMPYYFLNNTSMLWIDISKWNMKPSENLDTELMLHGIQQITLGKNTNFHLGPEARNPTIHEAPTDPNKQFTYYLDENTVITVPLTGTGDWQFVGDGNPLYPAGGSLTAKAIEDQYQVGVPHPQEPRTFVFEHNTNLNLNVDESDVKLAAGQTFDPKGSFKSLTAPGDASTVITPNRPLTYDEAVKLGLKVTGTDKIDYDKGGTFPITYNFHGKEATVKVTVPAKAHPTTPSNNGGGSSTPTTPAMPTKPAGAPSTPAVTPEKPTISEGKPATNQKQADQKQADQLEIPSYAAKKRQAVYAINRIYLYKHANFNKQQRLVSYPKQKRVNRPMFVVIDYARANNGALRYKVRDVNHTKKSDGKIGYITADWKFVRPVYYRSMPKNHKVTVINHRGVHAYKNKNLTGRTHTYKVGKHLTVKKLVKHNLTTRYQLSNGYYVTANKKLVIQGTY